MAKTVVAFAPGRVELLGNHTDYNEGVVLAAAIDLGVTIRAEKLQRSYRRRHFKGCGTGQPGTRRQVAGYLEPQAADFEPGIAQCFYYPDRIISPRFLFERLRIL